ADILLWRNEKNTFVSFVVLNLLYYWFFSSGSTFSSSAAQLLFVLAVALYGLSFLPSKIFGFLQVKKIPPWRFEISESAVRDLSKDIVAAWNHGVHSLNSLSRGGDWIKFFKVCADEKDFGYLNVVCSVARIKSGDTTGGASETTGVFALPNWPSDAEIQRLYTVDRSELLSTHWILLYLELVLCIEYGYGNFSEDKVSSLELVKVAIETDDETPLQAKSSVLYIAFRGLAIDGTDESVERKAVIKSMFNELTGSLALQGILCNRETPMSAEEYFKFVYI
ncbi:unnamed protein product, partial [Brassica oleracea]